VYGNAVNIQMVDHLVTVAKFGLSWHGYEVMGGVMAGWCGVMGGCTDISQYITMNTIQRYIMGNGWM